jgi:hypothetical protein
MSPRQAPPITLTKATLIPSGLAVAIAMGVVLIVRAYDNNRFADTNRVTVLEIRQQQIIDEMARSRQADEKQNDLLMDIAIRLGVPVTPSQPNPR